VVFNTGVRDRGLHGVYGAGLARQQPARGRGAAAAEAHGEER
jgi:hypothetical protein